MNDDDDKPFRLIPRDHHFNSDREPSHPTDNGNFEWSSFLMVMVFVLFVLRVLSQILP